jgi:PAS domain S-box-containing protein
MARIHPEDREAIFTNIAISAENMTPFFQVFRTRFSEDEIRWVKAASIPKLLDDGTILWNGVAIDISEQKVAEEKLRESETRFQLAMEASQDGLWDWDLPTDALFTSSGYARILGYSPAEMPKTVAEWEQIVPRTDWRRVRAVHADCIENKFDSFSIEFRVRAKDGTLRWIQGRGKAVERDAAGRARRLVGTHADITDRKAAEAEKARLEAQMHQAQKMDSIGRLAGGVAHDLNNLLSPILGYSEMLALDCEESDPRSEPLEEIQKAGLRARDLVRQLLTFSRKQPLKFQRVNLNRLLQNFEKLLRRAIREDVDIRMRPARSLPDIRGDVGQLEQVVMNLAVNAQDAMPEGGRLTIETGWVELDPTAATRFEGVEPGPHLLLSVRDTGRGLDEAARDHLFEPFFTTKPAGQGTGLGLATVYGIVKQHGGTIRVDSEPGKGTDFRVYLPVSGKAQLPTPDLSPNRSTADFPGSETLLVAEDDPPVRGLIRDLLQRQGYTVLVGANGAEALAAMDAHAGPIHLLLTDVVMPEMNGKQLADRVAARHPDIRVIFISGHADEVLTRHGLREAEFNFLQKPFTVANLAERVREVLDR